MPRHFSTVLLPGLMAVAIMFSGIAAVALPLAQEFGITREIDDRVMCPLPVAAFVAIEKICFSAIAEHDRRRHRLPAGHTTSPTHPAVRRTSPVGRSSSSSSFLASLALGCARPHHRHGRQAAADRPHLRRGRNADHLPRLRLLPLGASSIQPIPVWLQRAVLINPIVYMSEGLRAALTPSGAAYELKGSPLSSCSLVFLAHAQLGSACVASYAASSARQPA